MGTYHYKTIKEGQEEKEIVVKFDDHAVDPFRYGLMYLSPGKRDYTVTQ
jgi:hypothetical protein